MTDHRIIRSDRHIEAVWKNEDGTRLSLSVHHSRERKTYYVSVSRAKEEDGIVSYRLYKDNFSTKSVPAARYSAKALQDLFDTQFPDVEANIAALLRWAQGATTG